jgi:hypothetical protein
VLADEYFGYADVTVPQILTHLRTTYATLTDDDLETNRNKLSTPWNPDEPIEQLWLRNKHIRAVATAGGDPLTDGTVMRLTLNALEKAGVYDHPIKTWRDKPEAERIWTTFGSHFEHGEKERIRLLTAANAGFHGANMAITPETTTKTPNTHQAAAATTQTNFQYNTCSLYYCWTHGLNRNPKHNGLTCTRRDDGHKEDVTLDNRMGGSARITFGDRNTGTDPAQRGVNFKE